MGSACGIRKRGSPNDTVTVLSIVMAGLVPAICALPEMKKDMAGTSPATTSGSAPDPTLLQCFQIFDEVSLLLVAETKLEHGVIMIDHGEQIGGAAVVEVGRMLPERA
jgi:hypothetical protein